MSPGQLTEQALIHVRSIVFLAQVLPLLGVFCPRSAWADAVELQDRIERMDPAPARLRGVDVQERLGAALPEAARFYTAEGQAVALGEVLEKDKPVILTFNYSDCPMLCSLQLTGFTNALAGVDRTLGEDFQIITISLDPEESGVRLEQMKARYLTQYAGPSGLKRERAERGWQFLRGDESQIRAVTDAVGFGYGYNEERQEYLHPAALTLLTPSGTVARYLYGIEYHPRTMSLSLVEVSEGKIGGSMEKLILYCFHYDEMEGRYAPVAMNIMRLGGGLAALALGAFLGAFWLRESRKNKVLATS